MCAAGAEKTQAQWIAENEELRARLEEAEATLEAIRRGDVDAIVVAGPAGDQVYTLTDADRIYRTLIEEMNEGALTVAQDGMILYANRRFADLVDAPLATVIGSSLQRWMAPESQAALVRLLSPHQQARQRTELTLATGSGAPIPVLLSVSQLTVDSAADVYCVVASDLSEQKRTEQVIKDQLAEIQQYYDSTPVGLAVLDADLRYLRVNNLLAEINGIPAVDHIGRTVAEIAPTLEEQAQALAARVRATGEAVTEIELSGETISLPGVQRQWLEGWHPVKRADGEVIGYSVIVEEITERKEAERALAESQAMYRLLAEHSSDAVALIDSDGRVAYISPAYTRRLGYTESEMLHIDMPLILRLIHPDDRAQVAAEIARGRELKLPTSRFEYRCLTKSGDFLWLEDVLQRTFDADGNLISVVVNSRNITARKQAEAELERLRTQLATAQRLEVVGRLAGGIAHEFNNLLAVIMLRTEMLLMMAAPATPLHNGLDTIYATAKRSAYLVRSLLGYARKQVVMPKALELNHAVAASLPILRKLVGEEIRLEWQPDAELRPVRIDPTQLDQILVNLCINARDAIAGGGAITLAATNCTATEAADYAGLAVDPGDYTLLTVSDTGSGIAPDVLPRIFDPFFTTKEVGKGSGLGLSAVDGIVRQNGGFVQVVSQPGAGTTFMVYLKSFCETAAVPAPAPAHQLPRGHGETVLLVEDEASVMQMATEALEFLGYTVITASSPIAAIATMEQHRDAIDLLLTDVIMPEMNGAELAERITALRPGVRQLFLSGYPADVVQQRMHLAADAHFLQKPFSLQSLATQVQAALAEDVGA